MKKKNGYLQVHGRETWDPGVMENITALDHEPGYH
jgi:hypothetical protein